HERPERRLEAPQTTVRNGDALPEPRRAELLACRQAGKHLASRQLSALLEQLRDLFEEPPLGTGLDPEHDVRLGQQLRDAVKRAGWRSAQSASGAGVSLFDALLPLTSRRQALAARCPVAMTVSLFLVAEHLPVELVRERVDRRVHVRLDALGVDILAA